MFFKIASNPGAPANAISSASGIVKGSEHVEKPFQHKRMIMSEHERAENTTRLLSAINESAKILLASVYEDLDTQIMKTAGLLLPLFDVDRMRIWHIEPFDNKFHYIRDYGWTAKEEMHEHAAEVSADLTFCESIPSWDTHFNNDEIINGPISSLSVEEQRPLISLEVKSVLAIPIKQDETLRGFVSFDDFKRDDRYFTEDEIGVLHSYTLMLISAIDRNEDEHLLAMRLNQQELMSRISSSFLARGSMEDLITQALGMIGGFLDVTRVMVLALDKETNTISSKYRWSNTEKWLPVSTNTDIDEMLASAFPRTSTESHKAQLISCSNTQKDHDGKYRIMRGADLYAFIWGPVYIDGKYWGMISVEDCEQVRVWDESDIMLFSIVVSTITGAVERDIIEKERAEALKQALEASRAKGDFLSNMSHEMRTPMNAIIGMSAIGKEATDLERKDYALNKIEEASTHLLGIINDILDIAKIEANKFEVSYVDFEFEKMLRKVVNVVNFRAEERHQIFHVTIDRCIPQLLIGDEQRLAQVITNLLSNAIKFTPDGGTIRIDTRLIAEEDDVCIVQFEVSDTGIGITEEQLSRLFNTFEQAEAGTSRTFGGTGLGLAISKSLVELMGGKIWVESVYGEGSTFAFTTTLYRNKIDGQLINLSSSSEVIDLINDRDGYDRPASANIGLEDHTEQFPETTILLVEDIDINQEIVLALLEPFDITIDVAENGKIAVDMFKADPTRYDIIFMDVQMPEMDGLEATRQIRAHEEPWARNIPIVAMTANVFKKDVELCLDAGMNDHVGKPINIDEVLTKLHHHLSLTYKDNPHTWKKDIENRGEGFEAPSKPLGNLNTGFDKQSKMPLIRYDSTQSADSPSKNQGIAWDSSLETGHAVIDDQHKQLFSLVNQLVENRITESDKENFGTTLAFLVDYTVKHFNDEEELQRTSGFEDFERHHELHERFKEVVLDFVDDYHEQGWSPELNKAVNNYIVHWLVNHITLEDFKIAEHIRSQKANK